MASEKAAAEFQLEKELKRLQEAQVWRLLLCFLIHIHIYHGVQSLFFFCMFWSQGEGEWEIRSSSITVFLISAVVFGFAYGFDVILNR